VHSDCLRLYGLRRVVDIATGYACTGRGAYCVKRLIKVVRAGERSGYRDWLRLYGLWSVVGVATGYG